MSDKWWSELTPERIQANLRREIESRDERIEELEADLRKTALDYLAADWQAEEAYKAQLAAEVKLAEALEMALDECGFRYGTDSYNNWWQERRNRVAQLKGDKQ